MLTVCIEELVSETTLRAGDPYLKMDCQTIQLDTNE